ncbi:DUF6571 family protein [Actinomyces bowdenii]|nr:DUF6571 family protein [Actinomyces bowdenii]
MYPTDIDSTIDSGSTMASRTADIKTHASDLQTRLDEAVAMNESGILMAEGESGEILSYYLPDGTEDTAANVTAANSGAKDQAEKDAQELQDFVDSGEKDEAKYQELLEKMQAHQNNPVYADTFIDTVGPENLAQLAVSVESQFAYRRTTGGIVPKSEWEDTQHGDAIAQTFGYMLSAGSTIWDVMESWDVADAITHSLTDGKGTQGNIRHDHLGAVNTMLGVSQAIDMDGVEATEDHGMGMPFGMPFLLRMGQNLEQFPVEHPNPALGDGAVPNVGDTTNPLHGLIHAMAANPETARIWLAPETMSADTTVSRIYDMMDNEKVGDNQWTDDWTKLAESVAASDPAVANQDRGASTDEGRATTSVVAGVLNSIGESGDSLTLSETARNLVGDTLEYYPMGVDISAQEGNPHQYTQTPGSESAWASNLPQQPAFSDLALSNLLGQVGQSNDATIELQASLTAYNNERVAAIVDDIKNNEQDSSALGDVLTDQSGTNGFFAGAVARTSQQLGADADARTKFYVDTAVNLVNAIPVASTASNTLNAAISFTKAQAVDSGKTSFYDAYAKAEEEAKRTNEKNYATGMTAGQAATTMTLLNSGLYSPDEIDQISNGVAVDTSSVIGPDNAILIGPGDDGDNLSQVDDKSYDALIDIGGVLPSDSHPGLSALTDRIASRYSRTHRFANPSNGAPPSTWSE